MKPIARDNGIDLVPAWPMRALGRRPRHISTDERVMIITNSRPRPRSLARRLSQRRPSYLFTLEFAYEIPTRRLTRNLARVIAFHSTAAPRSQQQPNLPTTDGTQANNEKR